MKKAGLHRGQLALALAFLMLAGGVPVVSYATTTQEQLNQAEQERNNLQNELNANQEQLDDAKDREKELQSSLTNLNTKLTEVSDNLADLEDQIKEKNQEIEDTRDALKEAQALEEWQYDCMVKRIQYMYESGDADYLNLFFSIDSFGDMLNYNNYMSAIAEYDNKMMEEYVATRQEVEEIEARLQQELAELSNLQLAAETEKNKIAGLISQTSTSISQNGEDIAKLEADALKKEEELKQKESDIEALKKKIEEEKALSQAAANAAWRNISEVSFADGDKALLAAIIYCEAGGEPYEGKLAVGAVVINRVLSSKYPDTVVGVIYQKSQFSPVASGRLELVLTSGKATADCYKAAEEAMSGMTNVGNCLYFRTPIEGLTGISIGGHVFY